MLIEFDWILVLAVMLIIFAGVATAYNLTWWWAPITTGLLMLGLALTGTVLVTGRLMIVEVLFTWLPISLLLALVATLIRLYIDRKSKRFITWLTIVSLLIISLTGLYTYIQGLTSMDEVVFDDVGQDSISHISITKREEPGVRERAQLEEDEQIETIYEALSGVELNRYYQPVPRADVTLELASNQELKRLEFFADQSLVRIGRYVYQMDSDEVIPLLLDERWSFES